MLLLDNTGQTQIRVSWLEAVLAYSSQKFIVMFDVLGGLWVLIRPVPEISLLL